MNYEPQSTTSTTSTRRKSGNSANKAEGVVAYWGVENAEGVFKRLLELGGTLHQEVQDVGEGIKVAAVKDPFGNIFGVIENPNFKL